MGGTISMENHVHEAELVDQPYLLGGRRMFLFKISEHLLSLEKVRLSSKIMISDVLEGTDDEPAGPTGRIIDEFSGAWVDDLNHPVDDVAWGKVLGKLFVLPEPLEQVFV